MNVLIINALLATTVILALGILADSVLRRRGALIQNLCLRASIVTVLLYPLILCLPMGFNPAIFPKSADWIFSLNSQSFRSANLAIPQMTESELKSTHPYSNPLNGNEKILPPRPKVFSKGISIGKLLPFLWIGGAFVFVGRLFWAYYQMSRLKRRAGRAPEELQQVTAAWARHYHLPPPEVLISPEVSSPALIGLVRPIIVLPQDGSVATLEVLLHEMGHLKRKDGWWLLLGQIALAGLFFNPLACLLVRRQEQRAEEVCDDWVIAQTMNPLGYAQQLVDLAERQINLRFFLVAGIPMASPRSNLARRVERMMDVTHTIRLKISRLTLGYIALVSVLSVSLLGLIRPLKANELNKPLPFSGPGPVAATLPEEVRPNQDARASKIRIKEIAVWYAGPKSVDRETILHGIPIKLDQTYSEQAWANLRRSSIKHLYATGLIKNLRLETEPISTTPSASDQIIQDLKLIMVVQPRPKIQAIHVVGDDGKAQLNESFILSQLQSKVDALLNDLQVFQDQNVIEKTLKDQGISGATISYKTEVNEEYGRATLTFVIHHEAKS